ncbi:MAG: hypothetical protein IT290_06620 [Deltaproteobacteria bacterium]|nr:hypothetical protein [Deltaproteobacteria bacterium]
MGSDKSDLAEVLSRLDRLETLLEGRSTTSDRVEDAPERPFRIHLSSTGGERKPLTIHFVEPRGVAAKLSIPRAAILLALLMELKERLEESAHQPDPRERALRLSELFSARQPGAKEREAIRVATYRLREFLETELFRDVPKKSHPFLWMEDRLEVNPAFWGRHGFTRIEISSDDQRVTDWLSESLHLSPLDRLRETNVMFIPSGDSSLDTFDADVLQQASHVRELSLHFRPALYSYPVHLLEKSAVPAARIRLHGLVGQALREGRCSYTDVLSRRTLLEMVEHRPGSGGTLYPSVVTGADIIQHFDYLTDLLDHVHGYELVITDASFPFYLSTIEARSSSRTERYVVFFQHESVESFQGARSFVIRDSRMFHSVEQSIVRWVLDHPTTERRRDLTRQELERYKLAAIQRFKSEGSGSFPTVVV